MTHIKVLYLLLLLTPTIFFKGQEASENTIIITVTGIKETKGNLLIAFYEDKNSFLVADKAVYSKVVKVENSTENVYFNNVKKGFYAVAVVHDANSNGKLDVNLLKIPTELIGTSNNIKNRFGAPLFSDASFYYNGNFQNLTIELY